MRQTDFTLDELMDELKKPFPIIPKCALLNEIGEICETGNAKAEEFLAKLLDDKNPDYKFLAYCWLSAVGDVQKKTSLKLEEFKKDPANKTIVDDAREAVDELVREEFKRLTTEIENDNKETETTLCSWLNEKKPLLGRFCAYLWLSVFAGRSEETSRKLKEFEDNLNNRDVFEEIRKVDKEMEKFL